MRKFSAFVCSVLVLVSSVGEVPALAARDSWNPVGRPVQGGSDSVFAGLRVDIDEAGDTIATTRATDGEDLTSTVSIYDWDSSQRDWILRGLPISIPLFEFVFGGVIDLSDDGNTVVVGSPIVDGIVTGAAWVYDWTPDSDNPAGGEWEEREAIETPDDTFFFGWSVALSADSNTVVVGSLDVDIFDVFGADTTYPVQIFDWNGTDWDPRPEIDTEDELFAGQSVAVSADGNTVAFTGFVPEIDTPGVVFIYEWVPDSDNPEGGEWETPTGFVVNDTGTTLPTAIRMSDDGSTIAVSSWIIDEEAAVDVRVFDRSGDSWNQREPVIESFPTTGLGSTDDLLESGLFEFLLVILTQLLGNVMDLSGDGSTLAVSQFAGADLGLGELAIYDWTGSDWNPRGRSIDPNGGRDTDYSSLSVKLNGDASRVVNGQIRTIGAPEGRTRVYEWGYSPSSRPSKTTYSFNPAGGSCFGSNTPWSVTKRGSITLPRADECSRPGYVLLGWTRDPSQTASEHLLKTVAARSGRLTAVWGAVPPPPVSISAFRGAACVDCAVIVWQVPASDNSARQFDVTVDGVSATCNPESWGEVWVCVVQGVDPSSPHVVSVRGLGENGAGEAATVSIS